MPFQQSNIPHAMYYSTINAEILRICKATSEFVLFCGTCESLLKRMKNQRANYNRLKSSLMKLLNKHWTSFSKYGKNTAEIISSILKG